LITEMIAKLVMHSRISKNKRNYKPLTHGWVYLDNYQIWNVYKPTGVA